MFKKSFFSALLFLGLFFCLIFFSGCSGVSSPGAYELEGFVGGVDGLEIGVIEGAPPDVVIARGLTPFSFTVSLENVGEANVGPGTDNPLVFVRLAGIMYPSFGLTENTAVKTLDSRLESAKMNFDGAVVPGEMTYVSFDNLAYEPAVPDIFVIPIIAEVCYDYETYVTTKFCMKKDVFEAYEDASICTLGGPKPFGNSGAPLQITLVEEIPVNNNMVQLNFMIENVGNGVFFYRNQPQDLFDACVFSEAYPHIYKVEVFIEPLQQDTYDINCLRLDNDLSGGGVSGIITMFQGAPLTLSCFLSRTSPMSVRIYEDLLNIKLRYRYGESLEVPVHIQNYPQ